MLLAVYLPFHWLESLYYHLLNVLLVFALQSLFTSTLRFRLASYVFEESMYWDNVAFLILLVIASDLLNGIISQLHINLVFLRKLWIVLNVLSWARSYIALTIDEDLAIRSIEKDPLPDVKLTIEIEHRSLNQFLDHKGKILHLFFFGIRVSVGMSLGVRIVIMIMLLKNWRFVSSTSSNSIVGAQNVPKLIKVLKEMNSNTTIKTRRLKQP